MNNPNENNYDPVVSRLLEKLRPVPKRDPEAAARGRQRFLSQARSLAGEAERAGRPAFIPQQAVSKTPIQRLNGWFVSNFSSYKLKERKPMATFLTSMLLVIAILFGGTGATVYAAQDSQPDGLLYPVKTISEDVRLSLSNDPDAKLDLALDLATRRIDEMSALTKKGQDIPEEVFLRYQDHLRLAYQLAADMDDDGLEEAVNKIRIHLRDQDRLSWDAEEFPGEGYGDPVLARVEATLQNQLRWIDSEEEQTPLELQFSLRQRLQWLGDEEYNLESPYLYQHGDGDPTQAGDGPNQGEPSQKSPGTDDPGSGNSSDGSGPQYKGPGTGNDHQSSPDPQKNGKSN
jgi:hypothetical protein